MQPFQHTITGRFLQLPLEIAESATLAVLLINLGLLQLPLETRKSNIFNQCQSHSVKQLLVGQRVLESEKWKLDQWCKYEADSHRKS
jgi:hypothetical protein